MKKLDRTSAVMIGVFCVLVVGAIVGFTIAAVKSADSENNADRTIDVTEEAEQNGGTLSVEDIMQIVPDAQPGSSYSYFDDDGNMQTVTIPEDYQKKENTVDNSSKYKFTDFFDLSDKFLEVCKAGDVKELYRLYYGDYLERARASMETDMTDEVFESGLRANMLSVTGFDEYEYGSVELPPTQSAGAYAAQIYYNTYGEQIPLDISTVEDCVNLVVYIDNAYKTNHFMVKIDGYWYFII